MAGPFWPLRGFGVVVVFERQPRQQFLGPYQLRIEAQRLVRQVRGIRSEIVGGHQRQPEVGAGALSLFRFQRFVEEVGRRP